MSSSGDSTDPVWPLVELVVDPEHAEHVADILWSLGVAAVEEFVEDARVVLRTSTDVDHDTLSSLEGVRAVRAIDIPRSVADTWRETAGPTPVSDGIAFVPAWRADDWPATAAVLVEPGDAFGAGNHVTTVLAGRLILRHASSDGTLFDMGCGTGVLAVLAARHRGCRASAWDIAPGCRTIVEANVALNDLPAGAVRWASPEDAGTHDTVVANILAPVLRQERPTITGLCADGGVIILSGMRTDQVADVLDFYGLPVIERMEDEGWAGVALRKDGTARG